MRDWDLKRALYSELYRNYVRVHVNEFADCVDDGYIVYIVLLRLMRTDRKYCDGLHFIGHVPQSVPLLLLIQLLV
jgi:hypothetical protein